MPFLNAKELKCNNNVLIVNFNLDLKGIAKWGIVDFTKNYYGNIQNIRIYCETPLTENEKRLLDESLNTNIQNYEGATANSLPSTGYTALAWLDHNVTRAWQMDINVDFPSLLKEFIMIQTGGDVPGLDYQFRSGERVKFATPEVREVLKNVYDVLNGIFTKKDVESDNVFPGYILYRIAWMAALGKIDEVQFPLGDVSAVTKLMGEKHWGYLEFDKFLFQAARTMPPRFDFTLSIYTQEESLSSYLLVPNRIDASRLVSQHNVECKGKVDSSWLAVLPEKAPRQNSSKDDYYAAMMVLTFVRSKSKKRKLQINFPSHYQLNNSEVDFVINTLRENAYVTEFEINANHSLSVVKKALIPIFARNRWLLESGYRPPQIDDYWRQAAKYWVINLAEKDSILEPKEEHHVFKRCVLEMGVTGLKEVLRLLSDEAEREYFDGLYEGTTAAFYAACQPEEYKDYLEMLLLHLHDNAYFPYTELGISYQPGNDTQLTKLLSEINHLAHIPVRHESAPPLAAESAAGKTRPSVFRT